MIDMEVMPMAIKLIIPIILIAYYVTFKFCKSAATDNQALEDKLFLETYVFPKS